MIGSISAKSQVISPRIWVFLTSALCSSPRWGHLWLRIYTAIDGLWTISYTQCHLHSLGVPVVWYSTFLHAVIIFQCRYYEEDASLNNRTLVSWSKPYHSNNSTTSQLYRVNKMGLLITRSNIMQTENSIINLPKPLKLLHIYRCIYFICPHI